jgi:hypothetical protein
VYKELPRHLIKSLTFSTTSRARYVSHFPTRYNEADSWSSLLWYAFLSLPQPLFLTDDTGFEAEGIPCVNIVNDNRRPAFTLSSYPLFTDVLYGDSELDVKDLSGLYIGVPRTNSRLFIVNLM